MNFTLFSIYTRSTLFWSLSLTRTWQVFNDYKLISPPVSRCRMAYIVPLFFVLSFFFLIFSTPNLWGHWTYLNQTWRYIHLRLLFFGPKSPGRLPPTGLGQTAFWDQLHTSTETISAKEHNINNWKKTRQSTRIPQVSAHPLKIARRVSCRLTFARHFGLIIFARWSLWLTQKSRAWLALVRLHAGWALAGLCHISSTVYSLRDFSLCSVEYNIFKTCGILVWLKNCTSMIHQYDSRPKTERHVYLNKRYWKGNLAAKLASRR